MPTDPDDIERRLLALELAVSVLGDNVDTTLAPWKIKEVIESRGYGDELADILRRFGDLLDGRLTEPFPPTGEVDDS